MDVDRARTRAIDDAITFACAEYGIREGDILSDEQAAQFARMVSGRVTPYLVHTILASRLKAPIGADTWIAMERALKQNSLAE